MTSFDDEDLIRIEKMYSPSGAHAAPADGAPEVPADNFEFHSPNLEDERTRLAKLVAEVNVLMHQTAMARDEQDRRERKAVRRLRAFLLAAAVITGVLGFVAYVAGE